MAADDLIELYMSHLRELSRTKRTVDTYRDQLERADKLLPFGLDVATEDELRAYIWRDGYKPASRALIHASMNKFFEWAVEAGHLDFDPMAKVPRPKVPENLPRVATREQAELVLTDSKQPHRLHAQLAAYAGLRCIEIWRLEREHITPENIRIHGKGDRHDFVPTHPLIWEAVKDLPGGRITDLPDEQAVSNRFGRYCQERYHIKLTLHRLRGWFGTAGYRATRDPRAVQRALRHRNLANTMRYIAWAEDDVQGVVNGLPVFGQDDDDGDGVLAPVGK